MSKEPRYFNFPVVLLEDFISNPKDVLHNILAYCIYQHTLKYEEFEQEIDQKILAAGRYYRVNIGNPISLYRCGLEISNSIPAGLPFCGLNTVIYWDFRDNYKTSFDRACLLAFLAVKSILGKKPFCKITNSFLISRMDGNIETGDESTTSEEIKELTTVYKLRKIKKVLQLKWHLKIYGKGQRGFWVSFDLSQEDLTFEALKRSQKNQSAKLKKEAKEAELAAQERICRLLG